jgi:hypothetical protein
MVIFLFGSVPEIEAIEFSPLSLIPPPLLKESLLVGRAVCEGIANQSAIAALALFASLSASRAEGLVPIRNEVGHGDGRQNPDDGDDDHQFHQGKAFVVCLFHLFLHWLKVNGNRSVSF